MASDLIFEAESVTRRFGAVTAVDDLDLMIAPGELFCLLGANGAGKTTTINLFLGFLAPDSGRIRVAGVDPGIDPRAARRQLADIPENVALYPHLTG
ncbi:MAG: ATP-binding cassette domain-containing protein, partial [Pseudomonadota bacterium]